MSDRATRAAERIRSEISIFQVLEDYGFQVNTRGSDREQQFPCTLHGDGRDNIPSGRVYVGTGQYFCWACGRSRDAIQVVREKEGIKFWEAVRKLEKQYGLPTLPWEPEDEERAPSLSRVLDEVLSPMETPEQALHRVDTFLRGLCRERSLDPLRVAALWEAYDRVSALSKEGGDPEDVKGMAHKVLKASKEAVLKAQQQGV